VSLTDLIAIPAGINRGVSPARQTTMLSLLGNPRDRYDQACRDVQNPRLLALVVTEDVGPFRVRGLRPAVESLRLVLADVRLRHPAIHVALGTAGMLCARLVRGSTHAISNHSWGTAIDLTLNGVLDARGDRRVQRGLAEIHDIFNDHGWFWGAGFGTEDAMHFECSDELIRRWHANGAFGGGVAVAPPPVLSLGDRGPEVKRLQQLLATRTGTRIVADGDFGPATRAAVIAFQAANGLVPDGAVGKKTWAALRQRQSVIA
jgi:hypothetical protein